ncbi:MAG: DNA-processing protein DprA, partial [Firmicutes bacterium]|nr:DNA-processing protein DprA [Bacillota bacterium]
MYGEKHYLMWLNSLVQMSVKMRHRLLGAFGSAQAVWNASSADISRIVELGSDDLYKLICSRKTESIDKLYMGMEKAGARFVSILDEEYPENLRQIYDSPIGYYIMGEMPKAEYMIGVVGSRRCTEYGMTASYELGKYLAQNGIAVVSGMAEGIDGYAHQGALDGGGPTIAVMGTGIDLCYPTSHRALKSRIVQNGCVISEFPPGMHGSGITFPARNRIISGLSNGVAVMEAAARSGSLITADFALDQGRTVFALPGNITSKYSKGTNTLIKNGAEVLTEPEDILRFYNIDIKKKIK